MGRYVKSTTDISLLNKSLKNFQQELLDYKKTVERNNKELEKVNQEIKKNHEKEIIALKEELEQIESHNRWVQSDEPALKINPEHMLKKLNIL